LAAPASPQVVFRGEDDIRAVVIELARLRCGSLTIFGDADRRHGSIVAEKYQTTYAVVRTAKIES